LKASAVFRKRRILEIIILLILIVGTAVLVRYIDKELSVRMEALKKESISYLESWIGRKIAYDSISPSVFMFLEIKNLRIYPLSQPEDSILKLNNLKIHYNIIKLLFNPDPLSSLSSINISNTRIQLDRDKDDEIFSLLKDFLESPALVDNLKVTGSNLALLLTYGAYRIELKDLFFKISGHPEGLSFIIKKVKASAILPGKSGEPFVLNSSLRFKGKILEDFRWIDSKLRINQLSSQYFSLNRQNLHLTLENDIIKIRKIQDKAAIDLQLLWDLGVNSLSLSFTTEKLEVVDLLVFRSKWAYLNDWLPNRLTGSGQVDYSIPDSYLSYRIEGEGILSNSELPVDLHLKSSFFGDGKKLALNPLLLESEMGSLYFKGDIIFANMFPQGILKLSDVGVLNNKSFSASLEVERHRTGLTLHGDRFILGETSFMNISLDISPDGGIISRSSSIEFTLSADLAGAPAGSSLKTEGRIQFNENPELALNGRLVSFPVDTLYGFLSSLDRSYPKINPPLSRLSLSTNFEMDTDFEQFSLYAPNIMIKDLEDGHNSAGMSLCINDKGVEIERLSVLWEDYEIRGGMSILTETAGQMRFSSSLLIEGIPYQIQGSYTSGRNISITGSYGLDGILTIAENGVTFKINTEKLPLPLSETPSLATISATGFIGSDMKKSLVISKSRFYNLPVFESTDNSLDISLVFSDYRFDIDHISYQDEYSKLDGKGWVSINPYQAYEGQISLRGKESKEALELELSYLHRQIELNCSVRSTPIERFGEFVFGGEISASVHVNGDIGDPDLRIEMDLAEGRINKDPISIYMSLAYTKGLYNLDAFDLIYMGSRIDRSGGWFDSNTGNFQLGCHFRNGYLEKAVDMNLALSGEMDMENRPSSKKLFSHKITATLGLNDILFAGRQRRDWLIQLATDNDTLSFDGGLDNTLHGFLSSDWEFYLRLDDPYPLRGSVHGKFEKHLLVAEVEDFEVDMPTLNEFTGGSFAFLQGKAYGDLSISGFAGDPDFYGKLRAENIVMSFHMAPDATESISTDVYIQEKELSFNIPGFKAGETELSVDGLLIFSHWVPKSYDLHFICEDRKGLHIVNDFGPVMADGYVRGSAHVMGDPGGTRVEGNLQINYCRVTIGQEQTEEKEEESGLYVEMVLEMGKRVEFLWPSVSFPIIRTYAEKTSELYISYNSDTEETILLGDVDLQGGEVFYFDRSFYLKEGMIQFNENLDYFDPRISVRSEIRERDENNEEVKIYLIVENNKLSEFSPRFASEPNKSDIEIIALLGGPILEQIDQKSGIGAAVVLSTDILSHFGILKPFEQSIRDALGLDLFSIRTQVIQNMIIGNIQGTELGRILLGSGQASSPGAPTSLEGYLDNTTITFGKYIGNDLFLEMLLRLKEGGNWGLQSEMFISLEWPTPFFDLEWVLSPTGNSLDDFVLRDNRLTFRWRYSY
jgi:hypothetical protein